MKKLIALIAFFIVAGNCIGQDSAWRLTGNAGTTNAHFIGTTDNRPLIFRVNNVLSGRMDAAIGGNTFFGYRGGFSVTTGSNNSLFGYRAGTAVTTGSQNSATGYFALTANTSGSFNTANGYKALLSNTTGQFNTAIGASTLENNLSAWDNTATGYGALRSNTDGSANTAHGTIALHNNLSGHSNTAMGRGALFNNVEGANNTAVGVAALSENVRGLRNVAIGNSALHMNINGDENVAIGDSALFSRGGDGSTAVGTGALRNNDNYGNTAVGYQTLYENLLGWENTAHGAFALRNTQGYSNTAVGAESIRESTDGSFNTAVGALTLKKHRGSGNTVIGALAGYVWPLRYFGDVNTLIGARTYITQDSICYSTALGAYALVTASWQVRIGDRSTTSIGGFVNWSNVSDSRFKKNIQQNVPGLDFILQLNPVTYNLDLARIDEFLHQYDPGIDPDRTLTRNIEQDKQHRQQRESMVMTGFIAQEVEALAKKINYSFSGVDAPKNDKDYYGLRYAEFVVPLVKGMQEQQKLIEALQQQNLELQNQLQQVKIKLGMETIITKQ